MESFVYNFRKRFAVHQKPCPLFRKKKQSRSFNSSRVCFCLRLFPSYQYLLKCLQKKFLFFSVIRNEIQKSGFLKHTQTLSFYISLYNYRRIQNKSNSAHSLVGISVRKTYMQTFLANFSHSHIHFDLIYCPMVTFSGILYITLENSLIFTRSHAFCLEKNNLGAPTQAEFVFL